MTVYSHAAVHLTTQAFQALSKTPEISRAEALRWSMPDLMSDKANIKNAHPGIWAPFVIVGEGG